VTSKPSAFCDFWCTEFSENLTPKDYKFVYLTSLPSFSLSPPLSLHLLFTPPRLLPALSHVYIEKCKNVTFNSVIHMCFRLYTSCLGYYRIKWTTTVTMQLSGRSLFIASVRSDVSLRGHNCLSRHCSFASSTMLPWNSVHVLTSRCRNSTTSQDTRSFIMSKMR